jgi:hypothetical protein
LRLEALEDRLAPAVSLTLADASVLEPAPGGTATMSFLLPRGGDTTSQVTVAYTTAAGTAQPGTDFTPTSGTVTFAPNQTSAAVNVPVRGNGRFDSPDLTFSVRLTAVTDVTGGGTSFGPGINTSIPPATCPSSPSPPATSTATASSTSPSPTAASAAPAAP